MFKHRAQVLCVDPALLGIMEMVSNAQARGAFLVYSSAEVNDQTCDTPSNPYRKDQVVAPLLQGSTAIMC